MSSAKNVASAKLSKTFTLAIFLISMSTPISYEDHRYYIVGVITHVKTSGIKNCRNKGNYVG